MRFLFYFEYLPFDYKKMMTAIYQLLAKSAQITINYYFAKLAFHK